VNGREMAEDGVVETHGVTAAARVPVGASHLTGSSSEEGGLVENQRRNAASASNGARLACPVHLP